MPDNVRVLKGRGVFGQLVVAYLFLGGTGAGACVVLSVMGLLVPRAQMTMPEVRASGHAPVYVTQVAYAQRRLLAPGYVAAFGLVTMGALLLALDLGAGSKVQLLFLNPHPTFVTFGAYALALLMIEALLLAVMWGIPTVHVRYSVAVAGQVASLVLGLCVVAYTGLLLSSMPAVPFWSNVWVAVLFVVSSFSCGSALVLTCACLTGSLQVFGMTVRRIMCVDLVAFALEAIAAVMVLLTAFSNPYGIAVSGAQALVSGELSVLFLVGFGVVGIAMPAGLEVGSIALCKQSATVVLAAAVAVLAGGLILRYCIIAVGAHPAVWL